MECHVRGRWRRITSTAERIISGVSAIPPSGHRRFSRQRAPSTRAEAAASSRRCSTVPLLDSSASSDRRGLRMTRGRVTGDGAAQSDLDTSG